MGNKYAKIFTIFVAGIKHGKRQFLFNKKYEGWRYTAGPGYRPGRLPHPMAAPDYKLISSRIAQQAGALYCSLQGKRQK
jgi:hypothetical protein